MFDYSVLAPLILNTIIASIPEGTYFVVAALIFMKRFDLLEINRSNILRLLSIVVPIALLSNVLRSFASFGMNFIFIAFSLTFMLIILVYKIKTIKGIGKAFLSLLLSVLTLMAVQLLYFPFILYGTSISMEQLNDLRNLSLVLTLSIIDRVFQIGIVAFLLLKKQSIIKSNMFKILRRNKTISVITGALIIIDFVFIYIMCNLIYYQKILFNLNPAMQVTTIVAIILFPVLNLSLFLCVTNILANKDTSTKVFMKNEYRVFKALIQIFLKQQQYDKIKSELDTFEVEVSKFTK